MKRTLLWFSLAMALGSCNVTQDDAAVAESSTVSWSPRITNAQGGATVPKVDRIQLVIVLNDGSNRTFNQEATWSQGFIKVDNIPANVPFTATVKGMLSDGSLVWSGSSGVNGSSGTAELTTAVQVNPTVSSGISLDAAALNPTTSELARVYVTNWPFADNSLRLIYTTDGSDPSPNNGLTRTYAGPFTLSGSGKLRLRQYREASKSNEAISSAILEKNYKSGSWTGCSLPEFAPQSNVFSGMQSMNVSLNGGTNSGCELHYRTDGVAPTMSDPLWTATGIPLGSTAMHVTLRAIPNTAASMASPTAEGTWLCSSCNTQTASISAIQTEFSMLSEDSIQLPVQLTGANPGITWAIDSGMNYGSLISHDLYATFKAGIAPTGATTAKIRVRATLNGSASSVVFRVTISARATTQAPTIAVAGNQTVSINAGTSAQLNVNVTGATAANILWSIDNAGMGTLTPSGTSCSYMAPAGLAANSVVYVRATLPASGSTAAQSVVFTVNVQANAIATSLTASGNTMLSVGAGQSVQMNVMASGVASPSISWIIENAGMGTLTQTGASCMYYAPTSVPANASVNVRAILNNGGGAAVQSVLFTINLQASTILATLNAMGSTNVSVPAGQSLSLNVQADGVTNPVINWAFDGSSSVGTFTPTGANCQYYAPATAGSSNTAYLRASLAGTTQSVLYTINIIHPLQVVDSMGSTIKEIWPVSSGPVRLSVRYGTGTIMSANWYVREYPAGATTNLQTTGSYTSFQPSLSGDYRLVGVVGTDTASVMVHWPAIAPAVTLVNNSATNWNLDYGAAQTVMVGSSLATAQVDWALAADALGRIAVSADGMRCEYTAPNDLPVNTINRSMKLTAKLKSDPGKFVDFSFNIKKPSALLTVQDAGNFTSTSFSYGSTEFVVALFVMNGTSAAGNVAVALLEQPSGSTNPTLQITGNKLSFYGDAVGKYRLKLMADGEVTYVDIDWGAMN